MLSKTYYLPLLWILCPLATIGQVLDTTMTEADSANIQAYIDYYQEAQRQDSLLNYQHGTIQLENGIATLELGDDYKYLDATETKKILEEAWGNPPQETLGMIFPDSVNPYFDGWGVVLNYQADGYIKDQDAIDIDYDELLEEIKDDAIDASEERREYGYEGYSVIGWAEDPYYDFKTKKLFWAKEIFFEGTESNTLNYDIRVLGRQGYLRLNAIADISQLPEVKPAMQDMLTRIDFNKGHTYYDFDPEVDNVAAYGVGALVAGKLAAKAGLFKIIGVFIAKFWKVIVVALGAAGAFIKKLIGGKSE